VRRREFITLLGGAAAAWPLDAWAQQSATVARIGFLGPAPASSYWPRVEGLLAGLRDLGYVEGKNIVIEFRWAERVEQLPELAAELVRMKSTSSSRLLRPLLSPPDRRPKRSRSCSRPMPTPLASGMW
jgi:putative tryptophan/tyrosine transport system substrate-binding protein